VGLEQIDEDTWVLFFSFVALARVEAKGGELRFTDPPSEEH
jgi:hypothetical protein